MDNAAPPTPPPAPDAPSSAPPSTAPPSTAPPGPGVDDGGPRVTRSDVADLGRLRRTVGDRHVAGVAGGLARHLDIDPIIVRVALVVAVFFGGAGLLVYIAAWVLVPEEGTDSQPLGLDERSRSIALIGVGVVAILAGLGDWAGAYWFPWPLALAAVVIVWLVGRHDRQRQSPYDIGVTGPGTVPGAPAPGAATPDPGTVVHEHLHQPTYRPAAHPQPYPEAYVRLPNPRKRGPLLLWFTLALVALAMGVLGVVDLAGAAVVPSAYPALALAITAAMLVLGSFWGRAGGLILLGLLTTGALAVALAVENVDGERVTHTPTSSSQVRDTYELGAGEMVLDLSQVRDLANLDGRDITVDVGAGNVEVIVPADLAVSWTTDVGAGRVEAFGDVDEGIDPGVDGSIRTEVGDPQVDLHVSMVAGEITILESGDVR